jgi:peptidoglycan/xylan/chitin deacetylase (PgdA/CDA1 family)
MIEMGPKDYAKFLSKGSFVVFLLHGVVCNHQEQVRNYNRKHIEANYFYDMLKHLIESGGHPVSMDDILAAKNNHASLPERAFAVTFDDGFENNLTFGTPILEHFLVPATIYITTKFIDENYMSWIDRIEWAVSTTTKNELYLPWSGNVNIRSSIEKIQVLEEIRAKVKSSSDISPIELADHIQNSLSLAKTVSLNDQLNQKLSWEQVNFLIWHDLITIGAHTYSHQILSHLDDQSLHYEINQSINTIQKHTQKKVHHFSYPEGLHYHFTPRCVDALKAAGILICPTAIQGVNDEQTDLFYLNRIQVI